MIRNAEKNGDPNGHRNKPMNTMHLKNHNHENGTAMLPPADLVFEIKQLEDALAVERERTLRAHADFKNYRRRIEHDGSTMADTETRKIFLLLLDIVDDLEKALKWIHSEEPVVASGIRMIHHKLLSLLESFAVIPFDSIGEPFDHDLHEAVAIEKDTGRESGIVTDELRRGYRRNSVLLRAAQVRIAVK